MGEAEHDHPIAQDNTIPKYSDADVMKYRQLQRAAMSYLAQYGGTFEFLVKAKLSLIQESGLTVPVLRGVVNCMRREPDWMEGLPRPGYDKSNLNGFNKNTFISIKSAFDRPSRDTPVEPDLTGESKVVTVMAPRVNVKIKARFIWNTQKPSFDPKTGKHKKQVFHSLEEDKSYGFYVHEGVNEWRYREVVNRPKIIVKPIGACGNSPQHYEIGNIPPEGYEFCGNCRRRGAGLEAVNDLGFDTVRPNSGDALPDGRPLSA